jgi:hypothetical protein
MKKGAEDRSGSLEVSIEGDEQERRRRIAERAYRLFLERDQTDGHDVEDWLEAERQIQTGTR